KVEVFRASSQRPRDREVGFRKRARRPRNMASLGDDAETCLVSENAAQMRGRADRTADVAAEFEPREPRRERSRRTARRAAGSAGEGPGIVGRAIDGIVGLQID